MRAIQKVYMQGNSAVITIPRALLYLLELAPGDWVNIEQIGDEKRVTLQRFSSENVSKRSPGVLPSAPATPVR